jgi:hypothetical protein
MHEEVLNCFSWPYEMMCNGIEANGQGVAILYGPPRMTHLSAP